MSERLVDVTLSCNNGQLQAHKLVLAACSPYFGGVFDKLAQPYYYPVIVIKDMQIEDLRLMVDFMYKGQLTVSQDRLASLIKCAENLQITGLSNLDKTNCLSLANVDHSNGGETPIITVEGPRLMPTNHHQKSSKRARRMNSASSNQVVFERTYHHMRVHHHLDNTDGSSSSPDRLLEQSMITGESLDGNQQFNYANNHTSMAKNLTSNIHQHHHQGLHAPASSLQLQNAMNMQHPHHQQQQIQVFSHSLSSNRASSNAQASSHNGQMNNNNNSNSGNQSSSSHHHQSRGRLHPCNLCGKTFRERANLKRHLQVHSQHRIMYACEACNKTFSWKDNYIRHTKTAHHMNNQRQQA